MASDSFGCARTRAIASVELMPSEGHNSIDAECPFRTQGLLAAGLDAYYVLVVRARNRRGFIASGFEALRELANVGRRRLGRACGE
jgi:hypothetical protein